MKTSKRFAMLSMSIMIIGAGTLSAQNDEPGPFERFFRSLRRSFNEPQHRSTTHRTKPKQTQDNGNSTATADESNTGASTASSSGNGVGKPPNEKNTRGTSKAVTKKGEDFPYGTPVAGKKGFVTSPFSPNSGYIDVRGFAPGTPVKDPYTGKVFLTP
jgi:hypothetical protein